MSCPEWKDRLIDRLADELGEEESIRLEQHLAECEECREEELILRRLISSPPPEEAGDADPALAIRLFRNARGLESARTRPTLAPPAVLIPARRAVVGTSGRRGLTAGVLSVLVRPLPSYAAAALFVGALVVGVWAGHASIFTRTGHSSGGPAETRGPAAVDQPSRPELPAPPRGESGTPGASGASRSRASLADASGRARQRSGIPSFAAAPSDAIVVELAVRTDSL
jgi:anti-sigma factor RsiW